MFEDASSSSVADVGEVALAAAGVVVTVSVWVLGVVPVFDVVFGEVLGDAVAAVEVVVVGKAAAAAAAGVIAAIRDVTSAGSGSGRLRTIPIPCGAGFACTVGDAMGDGTGFVRLGLTTPIATTGTGATVEGFPVNILDADTFAVWMCNEAFRLLLPPLLPLPACWSTPVPVEAAAVVVVGTFFANGRAPPIVGDVDPSPNPSPFPCPCPGTPYCRTLTHVAPPVGGIFEAPAPTPTPAPAPAPPTPTLDESNDLSLALLVRVRDTDRARGVTNAIGLPLLIGSGGLFALCFCICDNDWDWDWD